MLTIPEKSRQGFSFVFEDEDLKRFTPGTIRYRLHNPSTDVELIGWTDVVPDSAVSVVIPSTANRVTNDSLAYETRCLTVQSDQDTDDQLSQEYLYRVKNLSGFQ